MNTITVTKLRLFTVSKSVDDPPLWTLKTPSRSLTTGLPQEIAEIHFPASRKVGR